MLIVRRPTVEEAANAKALIANIEGELALPPKEESEGMGPWAMGDLYFALYRAYLQAGEHDAALTYLREAANEPYPTPQLEQALTTEHVR